MKTVQQWLHDIDEDRLVEHFQWECPIEFWRLEDKNISVAEVYARRVFKLKSFLRDLKALTPTASEKMAFFATSAYTSGRPDISTVLISLDELDNDLVEHYDWMLTDREKIMGYLVADTELTQNNIYTVLTQILEEASFLGFSQDCFETEREALLRKLDESMNDIKEGKTFTADEVWEHLGLPPEKKDPQADELRFEVTKAEAEYAKYCLERELNELRQSLKKE